MINELINRYPKLKESEKSIEESLKLLIKCFESGGRLYLCGNGGSSSDADHIVGELMKGFKKKRPLSKSEMNKFSDDDRELAKGLMRGLPAISLHSQSALLTAFLNDADPQLVYAQTLYSLGREGDVLLAVSTSGNSKNVVNCAKTAKALGMRIISLTGKDECALDKISDVTVHVPEKETYLVQELHLPVYHYLCAEIEDYFFEI